MKIRASLSLVIGILVLGAFSACQEASKHKSQSTRSSQVSPSSVASSQDSLSDDRTSSASKKAAQSSQAQRQQPHSDSSISASEANSTTSEPSSPDTDLSLKPKAITKKQAHDFCHSNWVKQHYPCKKGETCHYTQEQVYDIGDPYQCKILSLKPGLAVILTLKDISDKNDKDNNAYYAYIDLVDISHLILLHHAEDLISGVGGQFFLRTYLKNLNSPASQKYHFFNLIVEETSHSYGTDYWERKLTNIYQYKGSHIRKVLDRLDLNTRYQSQDEEMENRLPKNVKNRCINEIKQESTKYHFIPNKKRDMPDLYLSKIIKRKWIRGYHLSYLTRSALGETMCDLDKPRKLIKINQNIKQEKTITFDGKSYMIPKSFEQQDLFY